jgi:hypothetical protein
MILFGKIVLGMAGVGLAGASVLCSDGFVNVNVIAKQPQGPHIHVIAPAMLAPIAVRLAPVAVRLSSPAARVASPAVSPDPQCVMAQAQWQIREKLPFIDAALADLRDADDFTLVEVDAPGEHVQVSKSGSSIVVDVDNADATVHVSAPIRALASTINQLAYASPSPAPL